MSFSLSLSFIFTHKHIFRHACIRHITLYSHCCRLFIYSSRSSKIFYSNGMYYVCNGNVIIYFLCTVCLQDFQHTLAHNFRNTRPKADIHACINYMCLLDGFWRCWKCSNRIHLNLLYIFLDIVWNFIYMYIYVYLSLVLFLHDLFLFWIFLSLSRDALCVYVIKKTGAHEIVRFLWSNLDWGDFFFKFFQWNLASPFQMKISVKPSFMLRQSFLNVIVVGDEQCTCNSAFLVWWNICKI